MIFRKKTVSKTACQPAGRYELLLVLNDASALLQMSARSETEVFNVFCQQLDKLGLRGGISLLDERGENLFIRAFAPRGKLLTRLENLTGLRIEGYTFPSSQVDVYRQVIEEGKSVFLPQSSGVLVQILPAAARRFAGKIVELLGANPAIYAPLKSLDSPIGVLNVVGAGLAPDDVPVVQAFANQLAVAIDNARLFTAMQVEANERIRVEKALRESGAKFMALTENAASAIFICQEVKIRYVNAAMEALTGYSREKLLAMNFWEVIYPDDQDLFRQTGQLGQQNNELEQRYEFRILRSDREIRWVDFRSVTINYEGDSAILGTAFDVTERKRMEIALQDSERKFRSIVHNSTDGILLADEQGKVIEWNIGLEQITGWQQNKVIGRKIWDVRSDLIPDSEAKEVIFETFKENAQQCLMHGETPWLNTIAEQKIQRQNGQQRTIQEINFPIPTETGFMMCSVVRDVTEQHYIQGMVRRRADELTTLNNLALDISTTHEFSCLLQKIVERAAQLLNTQGSALYLCNSETEELKLAAEICSRPVSHVERVSKIGEDVAGWVATRGQPIIVNDYHTWEGRARDLEVDQLYRAILSAPLSWQGELLGVLQVMHESISRRFDQADLDLLTLFANQASVAFENAHLLQVERKRRLVAENLGKFTAELASTLELEKVLEAILSHLEEVVPFDSSTIFLLDGSDLRVVAARGFPTEQEMIGKRYTGEEVLCRHIHRTGKPLVLQDAQADPRFKKWENTYHIHGWMGVPLIVRGEVIGYITLDSCSVNAYNEVDAVHAETFANQAAIAIENARLYELAARERHHLSLLYEVGRELAASLDPIEILERAISLTCQALDGLVGQAFLYSEAEDRLRLYAIYGRAEVDLEVFNRQVWLHSGDGLAGWVLKNREAVYVPNVLEDSRWMHVDMVDQDVCSAIIAPIMAEERLLGVLSVLHMEFAAFSPNHLDLLIAICREVGLALSNARRYQEVDRRLAEMTLIQNLALTFSQRLDVQELLDEVIEKLVQRLGYPHAEIFLVESDTLIQKSYHGTKRLNSKLSLKDGVVGRVARTGEIALIKDVTKDPDFLPGAEETIAELAVPILNGKVVIGVINIESDHPNQLTEQDRDLLKLLAGQISIALENAVLYERVRQHADNLEHLVAQRTAELVELYELSQQIGFVLSYEDLLAILLQHLRTAMNCDLVLGYLTMDGHNWIAYDAARQISKGLFEEMRDYCKDLYPDQLIWNAQDTITPVTLIPSGGRKNGKPVISKLGARTIAAINISGSMVGLLMTGSEREQEFSIEQNRLLNTFANQAATAIQRLSSKLIAEQKRLESLVEHLPTGVIFLDADFRLLVANPLGREFLSVLRENNVPKNRVLQLGPLSIQELVNRHMNPVPIEINIEAPTSRVFEAQARPVGTTERQWAITLRDVTQERETKMRIEMQDRLATVGQLAAGIAHDFNNIMAAILVYTDLLADDQQLPLVSRDRLLVIQQQVERAASLIRQILDFSRRSIMEQSTLDLLPFIKELDKILGRVLPETIQLELTYQPGSYLVNADPTRLQQVFMNLAVNARDAMPEGGRLIYGLGTLRINPQDTRPFPELSDGAWITIAIRDTGTGIPAEHLPHVFEPFFTTKPIGEGTGLGLAQVYGIVKQHDGFIDVKSQVGRGTTFTIYLPAIAQPEHEKLQLSSKEKFDGNGNNVLVVEDDRVTLEALRTLLESQNFHVLTAQHGIEALDILEEEETPISLVISDLVMPRMGGVALYRSLQKKWPDVKVLFVTGHPLQGENQALLERGEVMWLQKPFSVNEFSQMVRSLLVRP